MLTSVCVLPTLQIMTLTNIRPPLLFPFFDPDPLPYPFLFRCQANHWGKKGDPDRHKHVCKAASKRAASRSATPAPSSSSSCGRPASASTSGDAKRAHTPAAGAGCSGGSSSDPPGTIPITVGTDAPVAEFAPMDVVEIRGLKGKVELNGKQALLQKRKGNRWAVSVFPVGATKDILIKALNLKPTSKKLVELNSVAAPATPNPLLLGAECYVCLGSGDDLVWLGCACRGAAGFAHEGCIVEAARQQGHNPPADHWTDCPTCKQTYVGKIADSLLEARSEDIMLLKEAAFPEASAENAKLDLRWTMKRIENMRAQAYIHSGQLEKATRLHKKLWEEAKAWIGICGKRGQAPDYVRCVVIAGMNYAESLGREDADAESEAVYREILPDAERHCGKESPLYLSCKYGLASIMIDKKEPGNPLRPCKKSCENAELDLREVLEVQRRVLGKGDRGTLMTQTNLSIALINQGKVVEAQATIKEVFEIQQRVLGPNHTDTLNTGSKINAMRNMVQNAATPGECVALFSNTLDGKSLTLQEVASRIAQAKKDGLWK